MKNKALSVVLVLCLLVGCLAEPKISQAKTYEADKGKIVTLKGKVKRIKHQVDDPRFKKNQTSYVLVLDKKIKINCLGTPFKVKKIDILTISKKHFKKLKKKVGKRVKAKGHIVSYGVNFTYTGMALMEAKIL